ncbi:hypothetical protein [Streptomyces sp. OR43]|uniref:hypothetical protein n=1 Tax=Streptomyces sp. or43 TaxID=2478957 RepID=UPI0011CDA7B5|nr:hypothetical protein [Streptomyces sp. or43]
MSDLDYPVSLAVEDFVPVLLTACAAARLVAPAARTGRTGRTLAVSAAVLIAAGGLSKAGWKLVVALDGPDLQVFNKALFPLLSAGFLLLALALLRFGLPGAPQARGGEPSGGRLPWVFAGLWAVVAGASAAFASTAPVMALTIAAVTVCAVRLILLARAAGDTLAASSAGFWLLGMYVLGPLASRPDQSVALQWVEQSCNTLTQAAALLAAWRLAPVLGAPAEAPGPPPSTPDTRTVTS